MERTVSRKRIGANIKALAKWYGCKINEIEKEAGVSQGYLSRLNDSKNESSSILDLLLVASDRFRVSIDSLISMDFSKLANKNKIRIHSFFETLLYLSNRGRLEWKKSTEKGIEKNESFAGFVAEYNTDIFFYIFKLMPDDYHEVPGYSFYIRNKGELSKVVTFNLPGPALYESLDQLFESATASSESAEISEAADRAISVFMNDNSLVVDSSEDQRKYKPLYDYLLQQKAAVVHLTFDQIEDILGFPLPASFLRYPSFWANNENGQHHHCRAWLDAGYKTVNVSKNIIDQHMCFQKVK
ncbi:MAG: hypothetical protein IKP61_02385 [Spirochaetales bacterium]|nr:hypothetical protein [Spirochaetales bacterium]